MSELYIIEPDKGAISKGFFCLSVDLTEALFEPFAGLFLLFFRLQQGAQSLELAA